MVTVALEEVDVETDRVGMTVEIVLDITVELAVKEGVAVVDVVVTNSVTKHH